MKPKLILLDMDGTAVQYACSSFQSSWDALGEAAGKLELWRGWTERYLHQPAKYQEWFELQCASLRGVALEPILQKIFPPPYAPGLREFCSFWKGHGATLGIVSSGVGLVGRRIQEEMSLDILIANEIQVHEGKFTGEGKMNVSLDEKGTIVRQLIQQQGVLPLEAVYVGDHCNDLPAWKEVGCPLGMNLKDPRCYEYVRQHFTDFYQAREFLWKTI